MEVESYRATATTVEDLREKLAQAEHDLRREREARMSDIRTSVREIGKYADREPSARLLVEYMKSRAEFLSSSARDERHLKSVG